MVILVILTRILTHFPWKDLTFYIKKEEDKWTPKVIDTSTVVSSTSPDLLSGSIYIYIYIYIYINQLTPWITWHRGSMSHSQCPSNNPLANKRNSLCRHLRLNLIILILSCLGLPRDHLQEWSIQTDCSIDCQIHHSYRCCTQVAAKRRAEENTAIEQGQQARTTKF